MLELIRYDLRDPRQMERFNGLFAAYLAEVCDEEEYRENMEEMEDEALNRQMIRQTLRERDPYFVMRIMLDGEEIGFISYSYHEGKRRGFINNFYICPDHRRAGTGSAVCRMVEARLKALGALQVELVPVEGVEGFYVRNGFAPLRVTAEGEQVYCKAVV